MDFLKRFQDDVGLLDIAQQKIVVNKDIIVTPYRVDHSAYDSYMYMIKCDDKTILHTGDFRTHGWTGKGVMKLLKHYVKKVDVLICEGTMLSREYEDMFTEKDLEDAARNIMALNEKVFVLCSSTNIDSIASFYQAAMDNGRLIYADKYQILNLDIVTESKADNTNTHEKYDFSRQKVFPYTDNNPKLHDFMNDKGFCMFIRVNKQVMSDFEKALKRFPNNVIIYSLWEGYLKKDKPYADENIISFLDRAVKLYGSEINMKHTSGHAYPNAIVDVCNEVKPDIIIPIHSEKPDEFEKFKDMGKIKQGVVKRFTGDKSTIVI